MRIGIGFNKGSARVEGNLLVGCLHRRKYTQQPGKSTELRTKNMKDDKKLEKEEEEENKTSEPLLHAVEEETEENEG